MDVVSFINCNLSRLILRERVNKESTVATIHFRNDNY